MQRKIVIHKAGGYDRLNIETHPVPIPAPGEVLVETYAAGVNYADVCVRLGVYSSAKELVGWPITPGFEFSGRVVAVGRDVHGFERGDEVFGVSFFGGYASHVVTKQELLWKRPEALSVEQAAGFPAVFLTAYHGLFQTVPVRKDMNVLIHSAAGGVGSALVQLCKLAGLKTCGVIGSSHKRAYLQRLGVEHVIDKSRENLWDEALRFAPGGYDLVYDANGPETLRESFRALRPTGKLIVYGFHTMLPKTGGKLKLLKAALGLARMPRFNPLYMTNENKSVLAFNLSLLFNRYDLLGEGMRDLLGWLAEGKLKPPSIQKFAFDDVAAAHRTIESGQTTGKLILEMRRPD